MQCAYICMCIYIHSLQESHENDSRNMFVGGSDTHACVVFR